MMVANFKACGYDESLLLQAKTRAMSLDRNELFEPHGDEGGSVRDSLKFITTYHPDLGKVREFIKTLDTDLVSCGTLQYHFCLPQE